LGRYPDDARGRAVADGLAAELRAAIGDRIVLHDDAAEALGVPANRLRYAATTGTLLIRWGGARQATLRLVPPPHVDPLVARVELARRYLHVFGPTTAASFAEWAGIGPREAAAAFEALQADLAPARTSIGDAWILANDAPTFRAAPPTPAPARLLPSGDAYYLLQGADRELLVPEADRRAALWTSRVWPGAVLVGGEIVGTWRRAGPKLTVEAWRTLAAAERHAVEDEAAYLPLPDLAGRIRVEWAK
jgi:hypothetical protein